MSDKVAAQIDLDAAKALVRWKARFADEVASKAKRLAAESGQPGRVTLTHYRQAALTAILSLSAAIRDEEPTSDDCRAA